MTISERAVRRPVATAMVFLALVVVGAYSFDRLKIDFLPSIDFPSLSIVTSYPGVGPEEMENLVTRPIEQAVSAIQGVQELESYSMEGRSRVTLRFNWGVNLDAALNDVRAFVERAKAQLPEDADAPIVYKFDLSSFPVLFMTVGGDMEPAELRRFSEDVIRYRLERIAGVAQADVRGGRDREIHVELIPERLAAYGISAAEVVEAIGRENINTPAGQVHVGERNLLLRAMGEFESTEHIESLIVRHGGTLAGGSLAAPVYLHQLARVREGFAEESSRVRVNGEPGIRLSVSKQADANTLDVAESVRAEVERMNRDYAGRVRVGIIFDSSEFIEKAIANVQNALLLGAALAVLVLLVFLRSVRSTLVVGVAIPISVIGTFTLMYLFDITLNTISFGGIALGLGMLVDNSIVILENIYRHHEAGEAPRESAINGCREVSGAVIASTLTTLSVFMPVIFLGGFAAIFFQQMAFVVTFTLLCSLFVALTLVPVLAVLAMRGRTVGRKGPVGRALEGLDRSYRSVLTRVVRHSVIASLIFVGMLAGGLFLFQGVGKELMPADDQGELRVDITMPMGTRVEITERAAIEVEEVVRELPEAREILTTSGTPGMWSRSGEESAAVRISLAPIDQRSRSSDEVAEDLRQRIEGLIPGARIRVRATQPWIFRVMFGGEERLEVEVRGYDLDDAARVSSQVARIMESLQGVSDARVDQEEGGGERRIYVNRELASGLGLSPAQVGRILEIYVKGVIAGVVRRAGDEYPIRVQLAEAAREDLDDVLAAPVILPGGNFVPVSALTRNEPATMPMTIYRQDQERMVNVVAGLTGDRDLGSISAELQGYLAEVEVPEGFTAVVAGESAEQKETFSSLTLGLLLAILLTYMVMAGQFESFLNPFIIMLATPFSLVGAALTLYVTKTTLNVNSFMGMIVLTGVVVNNAIVMVDYIGMLRRDHDMPRLKAVLEGARRRLRPILMTTLTTCLALLPVAIESGEGGQTQAPLARVVVGGLLFSTLVTLFLIPIIYNGISGLRDRLAGRRSARTGSAEPVREPRTAPSQPGSAQSEA